MPVPVGCPSRSDPISTPLRPAWLFEVAQRLQTFADIRATSCARTRERDYADVSLPAPASPLERLLLRGLLLDLLVHRLGPSADSILRAALGPFGDLVAALSPGEDAHAREADRIDGFVERHLSERLTLGRLSRSLGTTDRRIEAALKEKRGTTVHRYIKQQRMLSAIGLLLESDAKTEFIHERVGYRSRSAFYRAFRQAFGRTPARVRKELVSFRTKSG